MKIRILNKRVILLYDLIEQIMTNITQLRITQAAYQPFTLMVGYMHALFIFKVLFLLP